MNAHPIGTDSAAWRFQAWAAFALSLLATASGIYWLPADVWIRCFIGLGLFFTVSSSFALAKAVRDLHESQRLTQKLEVAETERILRDASRDVA